MTLTQEMFRGAPARPRQSSHVDYRLARNAVIRNFKNGRLSQLDVCDAHPELVRAASHVGELTSEECPICEERKVVLLSYAFGTGLGPSGHLVTNRGELSKLTRRSRELTCYVVEVCPGCRWNHLARTFQVPRP